MRPTPDLTEFAFKLCPPNEGALRFEVSGPIHLSVIGPEPAFLVLKNGDKVLPILGIDCPGAISVTPAIIGASTSAVPEGVVVHFSFESSLDIELRPVEAKLLSPVTFVAYDKPEEMHSFFFDTVKKGTVEITLDSASPAVCGAQYTITQRKLAPFKRILFITVVALAIICVLLGSCRFLWRIYTFSLSSPSSFEES